jgi:hypothetical protein
MAYINPNISRTVFLKNPKFWQTILFIEGINKCEVQDGEKIFADGRNFRKEP